MILFDGSPRSTADVVSATHGRKADWKTDRIGATPIRGNKVKKMKRDELRSTPVPALSGTGTAKSRIVPVTPWPS
jgi:hypothetical protein